MSLSNKAHLPVDLPPQPAFPGRHGRELLCGWVSLPEHKSQLNWLCIQGGKEAKARPYLFSKFVFHLSSQFILTKLSTDLGENKRERHRPKGVAEREGSSSQTACL